MKIANIVNKISVLWLPLPSTQIDLIDATIQYSEAKGVVNTLKELTHEDKITGSYKTSYYVRSKGGKHIMFDAEKDGYYSRYPIKFIELVSKDRDQITGYYYIPVGYFNRPVRFNKV